MSVPWACCGKVLWVLWVLCEDEYCGVLWWCCGCAVGSVVLWGGRCCGGAVVVLWSVLWGTVRCCGGAVEDPQYGYCEKVLWWYCGRTVGTVTVL